MITDLVGLDKRGGMGGESKDVWAKVTGLKEKCFGWNVLAGIWPNKLIIPKLGIRILRILWSAPIVMVSVIAN